MPTKEVVYLIEYSSAIISRAAIKSQTIHPQDLEPHTRLHVCGFILRCHADVTRAFTSPSFIFNITEQNVDSHKTASHFLWWMVFSEQTKIWNYRTGLTNMQPYFCFIIQWYVFGRNTTQSKLHTLHCTLHAVSYTLYTVNTVHTVHSTLCTTHRTLYNAHCTLYTTSCSLYNLHYTL